MAIFDSTVIAFVSYLSIGVMSLTLVVAVLTLYLRLRLISGERQRRRFNEKWLPIMEKGMYELPKAVPTLKRSELVYFLWLWNSLQERLKGEVKENLNVVARMAKVDAMLEGLLWSNSVNSRLLAMNTAGHLQALTVWGELKNFVQTSENPVVALTAVRSLIRIDSKAAAAVFIPLIGIHKEWPPTQVAGRLKEVKPDAASAYLEGIILAASNEELPRLIRYLRFASVRTAIFVVEGLLAKADNEEVIAACLSVIGEVDSGQSLHLLRRYADHPKWVIKVQVANGLSKQGTQEDVALLLNFLGDREWWVRYRAAHALGSLPFMTLAQLEELKRGLEDSYAIDALMQVIEEKRMAV
ncbi:MAG: heat repeat protein [Firmicutes bacterium]|nr:heat repeat protein [Bacillota bacterium]